MQFTKGKGGLLNFLKRKMGFPSSSVIRNHPSMVGDWASIHWEDPEEKMETYLVFCSRNHGTGEELTAHSPRVTEESDII